MTSPAAFTYICTKVSFATTSTSVLLRKSNITHRKDLCIQNELVFLDSLFTREIASGQHAIPRLGTPPFSGLAYVALHIRHSCNTEAMDAYDSVQPRIC